VTQQKLNNYSAVGLIKDTSKKIVLNSLFLITFKTNKTDVYEKFLLTVIVDLFFFFVSDIGTDRSG